MTRVSGVLGFRRRALIWLGVVAATAAGGFGVLQLQSGQAAQDEIVPTAKATRGNLVVAVGGVGRIVQSRAGSEISVPSGSAGGASGSGSGGGGQTTASADGVFARTSGRVSKFLVSPGDRVVAGQALAVLDDGGTVASALRLAEVDVRMAQLELKQKRTSDPLKGLPPTRPELVAARAAVTSARARLQRVLSPPRAADVALARLELKRAEADLETLFGGSQAARTGATEIAQKNVELAQERLDRLTQPANPADVSLAETEIKRAEADLATLQRPPVTPAPEALVAAQTAISFARHDLLLATQANEIEQIREAQDRLDSALADLAVLLKPGPNALPAQVAAAQSAIDSAKKKLERLLAPPNPADVTAARLEVEKAQADLRIRKAGPGFAAQSAARQAVATARAKLSQLLGPPLEADVTLARLDLRRAEADLAVLRARGGPASATDIGLAQLKVAAANARLDSAAFSKNLLTVRAPWKGTVTSLLTVRGAPVDISTPVVAVADLSRLAAAVDLSEFDAAMVRRGLKAVVRVDALGGEAYAGKVRYAAPTGTTTNGVVTFPVQIGLTRAKGLKPGMNVSVRIIVAKRQNVLQVPLEAVMRDEEDRTIVEVIDGAGETATRRVKIGLANNTNVQILAGLRAGERVVLAEAPAPEEEA